MKKNITPIMKSSSIDEEAESTLNDTIERRNLQDQAVNLALKIVSLPDIPQNVKNSVDFEDGKTIKEYLGDLPSQVQTLIKAAWDLSNYNGTLSKAQALDNFVKICTEKGMRFLNPFNCFILQNKNYDSVLRNRF